jgi:hypothetical protein
VTLVEFLAPLKAAKHESRVLAVLYFCEQYENQASLTAEAIKKRLVAARVKGASKVNVPDVLTKSGALADTNGLEGKSRLWKLTESGRKHVRDLLGLTASQPELEHDVGTLTVLVGKVMDDDRVERRRLHQRLRHQVLKFGPLFVLRGAPVLKDFVVNLIAMFRAIFAILLALVRQRKIILLLPLGRDAIVDSNTFDFFRCAGLRIFKRHILPAVLS